MAVPEVIAWGYSHRYCTDWPDPTVLAALGAGATKISSSSPSQYSIICAGATIAPLNASPSFPHHSPIFAQAGCFSPYVSASPRFSSPVLVSTLRIILILHNPYRGPSQYICDCIDHFIGEVAELDDKFIQNEVLVTFSRARLEEVAWAARESFRQAHLSAYCSFHFFLWT